MPLSPSALRIGRQSVSNRSNVLIPKFPQSSLKARTPDQIGRAEMDLVKWTEEVQLVINRALGDLSLTPPSPDSHLDISGLATKSELASQIQDAIALIPPPPPGQIPALGLPGVFELSDQSKTPQEWFALAAQVQGAVVLLPPWPITLTGPIDVKNIAKVIGWGTALSKIIHVGAGPLFTGIYNYANHIIYPNYTDFSVAHFGVEVATFLELGGQQHIEISRLKIEGYPGGKYLRFVNADPVAVPGYGFGTWTENIRISNVFSYGHPAVGLECVNESINGQQNSFINFWCDMHFSLDDAASIGMLFHRTHITAGVFRAKFNLHAPGTCMKVENNSLIRNSEYRMNIEEPGIRLDLDATSLLHGYGTFIRTDVNCLDTILGQVISPAYEPILSDGYQIP